MKLYESHASLTAKALADITGSGIRFLVCDFLPLNLGAALRSGLRLFNSLASRRSMVIL